MTLNNYINKPDTYNIVVVKTGEVLETCRLKATATARLPELKDITRENLEVRKIKEKTQII